MKKLFLIMSIAVLAMTSCSNDDDENQDLITTEVSVDATSQTTWNYYSLGQNKIVGTGEKNATDDALWAARTDWDFAICRYSIRTNSGTSTSVNAQGGVYTLSSSISFEDVVTIPSGDISVDELISSETMTGSVVSNNQSNAQVIEFKKDEDGNMYMPPVYLKAPVYVFRTADGNDYYKVEFIQYKDEDGVTGKIKFNKSLIK